MDGYKDDVLQVLCSEELETPTSEAPKGEKAEGAADLQPSLEFQLKEINM